MGEATSQGTIVEPKGTRGRKRWFEMLIGLRD